METQTSIVSSLLAAASAILLVSTQHQKSRGADQKDRDPWGRE